MATTIKIKSGTLGNRTAMPKLEVDELGYRRDEEALYIGTSDGNVKLGAKNYEGYEDRIKKLEIKIVELEERITNS